MGFGLESSLAYRTGTLSHFQVGLHEAVVMPVQRGPHCRHGGFPSRAPNDVLAVEVGMMARVEPPGSVVGRCTVTSRVVPVVVVR